VVQRGPQGTYAYLIKPDKTVEMRPIKVAQTEANLALVDEGLKAGDQVVVDGQYKLQPGARVELTTPQPQPGTPSARPMQGSQATRRTARSGKP
jgi:multidrug efflux system membrane fusion protein